MIPPLIAGLPILWAHGLGRLLPGTGRVEAMTSETTVRPPRWTPGRPSSRWIKSRSLSRCLGRRELPPLTAGRIGI